LQDERALLGQEQEIAVGVVKRPILHVAIRRVKVHGVAAPEPRRACAAQCDDAVDEIGGCRRKGQGPKAREVHERWFAFEVAREGRVRERSELALERRRPHAVKPGPRILRARGRERRAADELAVQAIRAATRRILPLREGARQGLARVLVAEAGRGLRSGAPLEQLAREQALREVQGVRTAWRHLELHVAAGRAERASRARHAARLEVRIRFRRAEQHVGAGESRRERGQLLRRADERA
jgi:hypothetical protein